jgi:two-component system response regulator RegA
MDLKLESQSSLAYIQEARYSYPNAKIFMVTGYASIATTVEAIKQGADNYLPKPVNAEDILSVYFGATNIATEIKEDRLSPKRLEWEHIQQVLQENAGNISKTAEALNMHRRTLQRKLQKKPNQ